MAWTVGSAVTAAMLMGATRPLGTAAAWRDGQVRLMPRCQGQIQLHSYLPVVNGHVILCTANSS